MRIPRLAVALLALGVVIAGAAVAVGRDGGGADPTGPTAVATTRDLATTLSTTGRVERSWQRTVSHAAARPRPAVADGSAPATLGDDAPASTPQALTLTTGEPPVDTPMPVDDDPTPPVEDPAPEATTPTTRADTTPTTAAPAPTGPDPTTPPTTAPGAGRTGPQPPAADTGTTPTTPTTPTTAAPAGAEPEDDEEDPAVLTAIAPLGSEVGNGTVLYSADDEAVVALVGTVPAWRTLEAGVDRGADVRQLEEALTALGYGGGLTVDDRFTSATSAAVERWEAALGRAEPDGVVEVGDVVVVEEAGTVLAQDAAVGDPLESGTPVLALGSSGQRLSATVTAGEAASWAAGTPVELTWSDGSTTTGTVATTGREVNDGTVELTVALAGADTDRPTGAQATVTTVDARRPGAVSVPVAALVAGPDGTPAVRRPSGAGQADRVVAVGTGIVSGTWVEVRTGLAPGDAVRLPG